MSSNRRELNEKTVLDVAGGVSSFCAEANNLGIRVTAFDPIYSLPREKIRERSDPDLESVLAKSGVWVQLPSSALSKIVI